MTAVIALARMELRLYVREWGQLVFSFVFPPLMMLILAGVFASDDGPDSPFGSATGSEWYVVSYVAVPLASIALTSLPVMLASYRELGILKRYGASGVRPLQVISAQAAVSLLSVLLGAAAVLVVADASYGVPVPRSPLGVVGVVVLGAAAMVSLGIALGLAVRSVRLANAIGMAVFFPVFILGGGGPPYGVLPSGMQTISDWLPLSPISEGLRSAWLDGSVPAADLWHIAGWLVVGVLLVAGLEATRSLRTRHPAPARA